MPLVNCSRCKTNRANVKRCKTADSLCKECFYYCFETEIHETITRGRLFKRGEKVAIGASGGKDSTVLAYVLKLLNDRYDYGLNLFLLSIDEGITGYRDDSLETVKQNQTDYGLPLKILSYKDLYGWTMDQIVQATGLRNNCTFCGVFRRQALDRGAMMLGCDSIATGHNADDLAETILMNVLRGDIARLGRSANIITDVSDEPEDNQDDSFGWCIRRTKPFKYTYEKEIVLYARFKRLVYFSTECIYSPMAYRGYVREHLKQLEKIRPSVILDIINSGECFDLSTNNQKQSTRKQQTKGICQRCGYISSQQICKACVLLEGLNSGRPRLAIGKSSKIGKHLNKLKLENKEEKCSEMSDSLATGNVICTRKNQKQISCSLDKTDCKCKSLSINNHFEIG